MNKSGKRLSSFQTFFIFGCGVGFFGVILENTEMTLSGLALIAIGVFVGALRK
jgi:hypothetical protein